MTTATRTRKQTPAAPKAPATPDDLAGWTWEAHPNGTNEWKLQTPDRKWATKWYLKTERAVDEARRWIISQPKADPAEGTADAPALAATTIERALGDTGNGAHSEDTLPRRGSLEDTPIGEVTIAEGALPRRGTPELPLLPLEQLRTLLEQYAHASAGDPSRDRHFDRPATLPEKIAAPVDLLVAGRYQPREVFDDEELGKLADSIREHGVLTALKVFINEHGRLELIAGERRWRAAQRAGLDTVPAEICTYTLRQIALISAIDNLQRDTLKPVEEGKAYERLISDFQLSEAELARQLSLPRSYIQQRRALAQAIPEIHEALSREQISFTQARTLVAGAPGATKAQHAALKKLLTELQNGRRVSETDTRRIIEAAVLHTAQSRLTELGWSVYTHPNETLLWAPSERPRPWSGAEMLEALRSERRPGSTVPQGAAPTEEAITLLEQRYNVHRSFAPWIGISKDYSELPHFYAPEEVAELIATVRQEIDTIQERYSAAGWSLTPTAMGSFEARSEDGARQVLIDVGRAEELLTDITTGKVASTPAPTPKRRCGSCAQAVEQGEWVGTMWLCAACALQRKQTMQQHRGQIQQHITTLASDWLTQAPIDVLRLLVAATRGWGRYTYNLEENAKLRQASVPELSDELVGWLTHLVDTNDKFPIIEIEADVVNEEEAPAASTGASPLATVAHQVELMERWLADQQDEPAVTDLRQRIGDLIQIEQELKGHLESPDVCDEEFDDLTQRIGDLTRRIENWQDTHSAAQGA